MSKCRDDVLTELASLFHTAIKQRFAALRGAAGGIVDGVTDQVRTLWGGQLVYFSKADAERVGGKRNNGDQVLADVTWLIAESLRAHGVPDQEAQRAGMDMAEQLRTSVSSELIYIRKIDDRHRAKRDRKIVDEFDGTNHLELCRLHHISLRRLYQILSDQ